MGAGLENCFEKCEFRPKISSRENFYPTKYRFVIFLAMAFCPGRKTRLPENPPDLNFGWIRKFYVLRMVFPDQNLRMTDVKEGFTVHVRCCWCYSPQDVPQWTQYQLDCSCNADMQGNRRNQVSNDRMNDQNRWGNTNIDLSVRRSSPTSSRLDYNCI